MSISEELENKFKINAEVIDLRTLNPIDDKTIIQSLNKTKRLAVIEYGWPRCSISSEIISLVTKNIKLKNKPLSFTWPDSHIPTPKILEDQFYLNKKNALNKIINLFK